MSVEIKDNFSFQDDTNSKHKSGMWARTMIMGSNDDVEYDKNGIARFVKKIPDGINALGETIFKKEVTKPKWCTSNTVVIGGCQFAMELIFGTKDTQIDVPTLKTEKGIGGPNSASVSTTYDTVKVDGETCINTTATAYHHAGEFVQLFGIGTTGSAENDITILPVGYRDKSIDLDMDTTDGTSVKGIMIPFRYMDNPNDLNSEEKSQYFGKYVDSTNRTCYYLKRFENEPVIKHIWRTADMYDNETLVPSSEVWETNKGLNTIESFTECVLKVNKKDVKEWFRHLDQEDRCRINTVALFSGYYVPGSNGTIGDYRDVRMFSKLCIPTEYLSLNKDLNIIYRVYTS